MTKRIVSVVTNVGHYDDPTHPTGLWLAELTHAWDVFEQSGFEQTLVSPIRTGWLCWRPPPAPTRSTQPPTTRSASPAAMPSCATSPTVKACGYCGLLNTKLSDGSNLVAGRKMTGFAWTEEVLARVDKVVPYNAEEEVKKRGALYEKALLPFVSYVVVDGNLVTGQNPGSAKATAKKVAEMLS